MKIKGKDMKAIMKYRENFGKRSAYIIEYEDGTKNNGVVTRHITATIVNNKTGERNSHWYLGVGADGLKELNKVALLNNDEFSKAETNEKYYF